GQTRIENASRRVLARRHAQHHHLQTGAYWWSRSEGSHPLSAAVEVVEERGRWIERMPNPNWRPKSLFGL
ncbi:MAG: DUF6330 family protein, partial [Pseudomonadota bacterium]